MVELGNLHAVAIDHPIVVGVVAGNGTYTPVQVYLLFGLVEYTRQVFCLHGGRIDGDGCTLRSAVVGEMGTVKNVVHFIGAYILSLWLVCSPRAVVHPEFQRAPVPLRCGLPHQILHGAVENKARCEGWLFLPLQRLGGEVLLDIDVVTAGTPVHVAKTAVLGVAP